MSAVIVRPEEAGERDGILALVEAAFGRPDEARLVAKLHQDGDVVLSLVAERNGEARGHILFSRLFVETGARRFAAVALAPVSVVPSHQRQGIGRALIEDAHARLAESGEKLSVVLGDPAYYGRLGYTRDRAAGFASAYQSEALQAAAWGDAPETGRLVYPPAFAAL